MGSDLEPLARHRVLLVPAADEPASGLADMLQQFLEQLLEEEPKKRQLAPRLSGQLLFRAAEDEDVCVRIAFGRDAIEVADHKGDVGGLPSLTADFLTTAHLTTGQESPFALLARRKMRVRCRPWQLWFLVRVLAFMRIPSPSPSKASGRVWLYLLAIAAALVAGYWWLAR